MKQLMQEIHCPNTSIEVSPGEYPENRAVVAHPVLMIGTVDHRVHFALRHKEGMLHGPWLSVINTDPIQAWQIQRFFADTFAMDSFTRIIHLGIQGGITKDGGRREFDTIDEMVRLFVGSANEPMDESRIEQLATDLGIDETTLQKNIAHYATLRPPLDMVSLMLSQVLVSSKIAGPFVEQIEQIYQHRINGHDRLLRLIGVVKRKERRTKSRAQAAAVNG